MRVATISQPRYLPYLGYFHRLAFSQVFVILDTVQFKGREWDRRNKIRVHGAKDWTWLTVPVLRAPRETIISEIRIDNSQNWQEQHWRTLEGSYKRAPYFDRYAPDLSDFYRHRYDSIRDLNTEMILYFCDCLGISPKIVLASTLEANGASTDLLVRLCQAVQADIYWSGGDGRRYIDEEKFARVGISLSYQDYNHPAYSQIHGHPFVPYMGIADLLFNCGPASLEVLLNGNSGPASPSYPILPQLSRTPAAQAFPGHETVS